MSTVDLFNFITQQILIYFGLFILVFGVIGGILNVIIFTTLNTFRETTCGFYLTTVSLINTAQLLTILFVRILSDGFGTGIRSISWVCRTHNYVGVWCVLLSMTIICLAVIDQYISMSAYRHYSTKRLARRAILSTFVIVSLYCICFAIYWGAPSGICASINSSFTIFATHFHFPILIGFLPLTTMTTFSLLAFYSARTLNRRQINIVRLSRDRQLTAMTLCHVVFVVITTLPFIIFFIYTLSQTNQDPERIARNNLISAITTLIYYLSFAVSIQVSSEKRKCYSFLKYQGSFYIYCCVSERFRKQLLFVLMKVCVYQWQQGANNRNNNQVVPHVEPRVMLNQQNQTKSLSKLFPFTRRRLFYLKNSLTYSDPNLY